MKKLIHRLLWRKARHEFVKTKGNALLREVFATFQIPAAPPTGRSVKSSRTGDVFRRLPASAVPEFESCPDTTRIFLQWGMWEREHDGGCWSWPTLLGDFGPVALLPNDEDPEEARLYGPVGQRWGDPTKPCPHGSCRLGMFHIGPHESADPEVVDARLFDLPMRRFSGNVRVDPEACSCRHPSAHLPTCARYERISGGQETSPDV